MKHYRTSSCFFIATCILLSISCNKKNALVGKWNLVDKRVVTTNHDKDSFENAHAKEDLKKGESFTFLDDESYLHKTGSYAVQGKYMAKDSFVALTNDNLAMPVMTEGYKYHLSDANNLQLIEEITETKTGHVFTYTLFLKRELK